jgi:hypothetical protein
VSGFLQHPAQGQRSSSRSHQSRQPWVGGSGLRWRLGSSQAIAASSSRSAQPAAWPRSASPSRRSAAGSFWGRVPCGRVRAHSSSVPPVAARPGGQCGRRVGRQPPAVATDAGRAPGRGGPARWAAAAARPGRARPAHRRNARPGSQPGRRGTAHQGRAGHQTEQAHRASSCSFGREAARTRRRSGSGTNPRGGVSSGPAG